MASIKISYTQVEEAASDIRAAKAKMQKSLEDTKISMQKIGGTETWESSGASQARATFDSLNAKFEPFCEDVETYAKFLDDVAQIYRDADAALGTAAGGGTAQ